jgi:hypothetical protein
VIPDLSPLGDDAVVAAMRRRDHGLLYAPRPPFHIGLFVADDVAEPVAYVVGPHTRQRYRWRAAAIVDDAERAVATPPRTGRVSVDARALADAAFADATAGPWLFARTDSVKTARWQRVFSGLTIGRSRQAHVPVQSSLVARQHCRFALDDGRWYIEDLASTNGTYIDRVRIQRAALDRRTRIEVAGHSVEFFPTLSPPHRAIDATDPDAWAALFLDRIELDLLTAQLASEVAEVPPLATLRARAVTWSLDGVTLATDVRWLMPNADDAGVWFDALVAREGDELPSPIVGDDCACFAAAPFVVVVARVGALVGRLAVVAPVVRADDLAAAVAARPGTR